METSSDRSCKKIGSLFTSKGQRHKRSSIKSSRRMRHSPKPLRCYRAVRPPDGAVHAVYRVFFCARNSRSMATRRPITRIRASIPKVRVTTASYAQVGYPPQLWAMSPPGSLCCTHHAARSVPQITDPARSACCVTNPRPAGHHRPSDTPNPAFPP